MSKQASGATGLGTSTTLYHLFDSPGGLFWYTDIILVIRSLYNDMFLTVENVSD